MKKLFTLLFAAVTVAATAQSLDGKEVVFEDKFRNNKNGWDVSMSGENRTKVSSDYQFLIIGINGKNTNERASVYTDIDFNKDFVLKAEVKSEPRDKKYDSGTEFGFYIGHTNFKYRKQQGFYAYTLRVAEDEKGAFMYAQNSNGTQLFRREMDNLSRFNPTDYNEIALAKEGSDIVFYMNGSEIYRNDATGTEGGAITFYAYGKQKAYTRKLEVYLPSQPTAEEIAAEEAKAEVITEAEEEVILEAVSNLEFDVNKSSIKSSSLPTLNKMAEMMIKNTKFRVLLTGHTDNVGNDDANVKLSLDRVNSVKSFLVDKGIDGGRISTLGYGDQRPIATNETAEGRQRNRRVEFEIIQ